MPDFELVPQPTAAFALQPWTDPPVTFDDALASAGVTIEEFNALPDALKLAITSKTRPSRVTTTQNRPRFAWTARVNATWDVWCKPNGGDAGAPDSELGGRLFEAWFAEGPTLPDSPNFSFGYTGRIFHTPTLPGHYTLVVRRPQGGGVVLHIDVIDPANPAPP